VAVVAITVVEVVVVEVVVDAASTVAVDGIATSRSVSIRFKRTGLTSRWGRFRFRAGTVVSGWSPRVGIVDLLVSNMEEHIEVEGRIVAVLAGTMFRVQLDNEHIVLATISGKMRKRFVRLTAGDRVKMEMSPYDLNKARIVWRLR
jgi:translation initiation factor IF-1